MSLVPSDDLRNGNRSLPNPPIDAPEVIAFGEFLRTAREQRGITLEQICRETKIPRRHLEAIEHGQLASVPSGPYRRGEIVAYAKVVGLDRNVALHRLERASETFERHAPEIASPRPAHLRTQRFILFLAAAALVSFMTWNRTPAGAPDALRGPIPAGQPTTGAPAPGALIGAAKGDGAAPQASIEASTSSTPVRSEAAALPTPPTTKPESGFVIVSDPPGARVTVDGIGWGTTPLTIHNLPPGLKQIRLTKAGYESATRAVRVVDGQKTSISVALQSNTPPGP